MNTAVNYDSRMEVLRRIVSLQPEGPHERGHVLAAQLRLLYRVEAELAAALRRSGMGAEAAAQSALQFCAQAVERIRASTV